MTADFDSELIVGLLATAGQPMKSSAIADELRMDRRKITQMLMTLANEGTVRRFGNGYYVLNEDGVVHEVPMSSSSESGRVGKPRNGQEKDFERARRPKDTSQPDWPSIKVKNNRGFPSGPCLVQIIPQGGVNFSEEEEEKTVAKRDDTIEKLMTDIELAHRDKVEDVDPVDRLVVKEKVLDALIEKYPSDVRDVLMSIKHDLARFADLVGAR